MRKRTTLLLVTMLATSACDWEDLGDAWEDEHDLRDDLDDVLDDTGAPGAIVQREAHDTLRARAGSNNFGEREIAYDAQFRVASVSKTFAAVVVLQLVQEGKLALSDSVEKWLPGLVSGDPITIEQLLRHQSGLPNYLQSPRLAEPLASSQAWEQHHHDAATQAQYVSYALELPRLPREFAYSNTNYVLLGMIIEAVTKQSWGDQVAQRIIAPLQLSGTDVPGSNPYLSSPYARGWMRFGDEKKYVDVSENSWLVGADAGVVSTLEDLNTFFRALIRGELLSPDMLTAMQQTVPVDGGGYGLGLQWSPLRCGGGYWHHDGDTLGYTVRTGVLPDGSRSVALMVDGALDDDRAAARLIDHALCR
ncbi:MAG TPA: serine hydrolase domain-containing protein [Polyangiales bacterium]|nr:serine hydrolase domain-containing protein [Polyangiales bacterium]